MSRSKKTRKGPPTLTVVEPNGKLDQVAFGQVFKRLPDRAGVEVTALSSGSDELQRLRREAENLRAENQALELHLNLARKEAEQKERLLHFANYSTVEVRQELDVARAGRADQVLTFLFLRLFPEDAGRNEWPPEVLQDGWINWCAGLTATGLEELIQMNARRVEGAIQAGNFDQAKTCAIQSAHAARRLMAHRLLDKLLQHQVCSFDELPVADQRLLFNSIAFPVADSRSSLGEHPESQGVATVAQEILHNLKTHFVFSKRAR